MRKQIIIAALLAAVSATPALAQYQGRDGAGGRPQGSENRGQGRPQVQQAQQPAPAAQVQQPQVQQPQPQRAQVQRSQGQRPQGQWGFDGRNPQVINPALRNGRQWNGQVRGQFQGQQGQPQRQGQRPQDQAQRGDGVRGYQGNRNDNGVRDWRANNDGNRNRDPRFFSNNGGQSNRDWRNNNARGQSNWRGNNNDRGRSWNRDWRGDQRYNWQTYRSSHRNFYRLPQYQSPYGYGYGYQRFGIGVYLDSQLFGQDYWIDNPYEYRLPEAYPPYHWVRYYNDALLVDEETGYVVDTIYDIFD